MNNKRNKKYSRITALIICLLLAFQATGAGSIIAFAETVVYLTDMRVYVGDLQVGDILEEGVTLYPSPQPNDGVTNATIYIDDDEGFTLNQTLPEESEVPSAYITDRKLRVYGIKYSVYTKQDCEYKLVTYTEDDNLQKYSAKNSRVYVGDINIGDVVGAGAVIHAETDFPQYTEFYIYVDDSFRAHINNKWDFFSLMSGVVAEWNPSVPIMLVSAEPDPQYPNELTMHFETYYGSGQVGSEASLNLALDSEETIVLANNIELSDCFFVRDGKEHILDLNGYTLRRNMEQSEATGHVLQVNAGSKLTIIDSSDDNSGLITGGWAPNGGGIYVDGELIIEGGTVADNTADNGGGIFIRNGTLTLNGNTLIEQNYGKYGGGIYIDDAGTANLNGGRIEYNDSVTGGGIEVSGELNAAGTEIISNTANSGSGIFSYGTVALKNCEIRQNTNARSGGGIKASSGSLMIENCMICNNSSSESGGGIWIGAYATTSFNGENTISDNYSATGGGIYATNRVLELDNVNIVNNTGCGIYQDLSGKLILKNVNVTDNFGGIYMNDGTLELAGGKTVVNENRGTIGNSNVVFGSFRTINVTGELFPGSRIGITVPGSSSRLDVTSGYSDHNAANTDQYFFSDTQYYRVKVDKEIPEVRFVTRLLPTTDRYKIRVTVKVTDDADWWDWAYLDFFVRDNHGLGTERQIRTTPDFCESIDHSGGYYAYEVDCGTSFPSAVNFSTKYGTAGSWRDFEADVKIYINDVNCGSQHCVHNVYGVEVKKTKIVIAGDKYPYPELDIDQRSEIETDVEETKYVTITAVDQYGVSWTTNDFNGKKTYKMENLSFPKTDTCIDVSKDGLKWKMQTTYETNHHSEYRLTFYSGSNVYPEISTVITVYFAYPIFLTVVVDGKTVLYKKGQMNERIQLENYPCKTGYYIKGYDANGSGFLDKDKETGIYTFGFGNQNVILTAKLAGISYKVQFNKNGDPLKNGTDVTGVMGDKTLTYDKSADLPKKRFNREGYTFVGWNTEPDGSGTAYADREIVMNLACEAGSKVQLYAQWQPDLSMATASIFAEGTLAVYIGGAVILISLISAVTYTAHKKKKERS